MNNLLEIVYSWPFVGGAAFGAVAMKLYQWRVCRELDRTRPLPDGRRRHVPGISQQFWGGLLAVGVLGYVLLQVAQTEQQYRALSATMQYCNRELLSAQNARARITSENDALSVQQRDLLTDLDEASGTWVDRLINPPPEIAALLLDHPRRQSWSIDVTRIYFDRASKLRAHIADIRKQQSDLVAERAAHPLPPPTCGQ